MNYDIRFIRTFSHPEIWDNFLSEKYDLVEKKEYKQKRLEAEIEEHKSNIERYKKFISEEDDLLEQKTKELKKIT